MSAWFFCYNFDHDAIQGDTSSADRLRERELDNSMTDEDGAAENDIRDRDQLNNSATELFDVVDGEKAKADTDAHLDGPRGVKRSNQCNDLLSDDKKCSITVVDSDDEASVAGNRPSHMEEAAKSEGQIVSSSDSDSDSDSDDSDADIGINAR